MCQKPLAAGPGPSPQSLKLDGTETSQRGSSQEGQQVNQLTFAQVVMSGPQARSRSASQKSVSTDEGSASSGWSSSPVSCEGPTRLEHDCHPVSDVVDDVCTPLAPLWVDNGLKGDASAWLLVLPKSSSLNGHNASNRLPKSPKDAVLLGPYVTTKNTFLEESRIGESLAKPRPRTQSLGAHHCRWE